jgi:hypothetical protein
MIDLSLTPEEIERYVPYHRLDAFVWGFEDYGTGSSRRAKLLNEVAWQAYDCGVECARRRKMKALRGEAPQ